MLIVDDSIYSQIYEMLSKPDQSENPQETKEIENGQTIVGSWIIGDQGEPIELKDIS